MLSGLAACAALTALVAGVAGAWSPCGFSMVETIGSALGGARRTTLTASFTFTVGALLGGVVTFGGLALLGELAGHAGALRELLTGALVLAAAVGDWRGWRIAPQIRRQVPERWRWRAPLALACGLYGVLLGLAFTTFVLAFAVWALAGVAFGSGDVTLGVLVGAGFGLGRALPVLAMAPRFAAAPGGSGWLAEMADEPRLWLGLRRLGAIGLGGCALLLAAASAGAAVVTNATDPSSSVGALAWQQLGGPGELSIAGGTASSLAGTLPALGGSKLAWLASGTITVAQMPAITPVAGIPAQEVSALAVDDAWVVYRQTLPGAGERLVAVALADPATTVTVATSALAGSIGRPSLSDTRVVYSVGTQRTSRLLLTDLASSRLRVLRSFSAGAAVTNPSLLAGRLLYVRTTRCEQQLRLGGLRRSHHERVLLRLRATVARDPGYQRGYEHAYNRASLCGHRRGRRGIRLGATALTPRIAYVTEIRGASAKIVAIPRRRKSSQILH